MHPEHVPRSQNKTFWPHSIRTRMTLGFSVFIGLLMLLVCAAFYSYTRRIESKNADAVLYQMAQEVRQELKDSDQHSLDAASLIREERAGLRARDMALFVLDERGQLVAQSTDSVPSWPLHNDDWRVAVIPNNTQTLLIALPWNKIEHALRERALLLLVLSTLVVLAAAGGAWVLVGRTLSPIDQLTRQAQAASAESLRIQLDAPSPDHEITRLVATLNNLLVRLQHSAAVQGRFYAAASHELRTPLQALTGNLEVALSRQRTAQDYRVALCESHAQAERLTTLVQDLLLLNQLDADTSCPPWVLLDLVDVCETELSRLRSLADERCLTVELCLPNNYEMMAPWNHVMMLIRNLLDNATKYATEGGKVKVQLLQNTLMIWNDCEPVEGWDTDKHFEPFFRPDVSRNSRTGGNGLGLAICKAVCVANGWIIILHQGVSGVSVKVTF